MEFPAHFREGADGVQRFQTVQEHCRHCAQYASHAVPQGLYHVAYLAGLLHDMGKFTLKFWEYLLRAANGNPMRRGSVNHTFAGARFVLERWHTPGESSFENMVCEIAAFAAGAHHGQFDCFDPSGKNGFLYRFSAEGIDYSEACGNFLAECAALDELDSLFHTSVQEITAAVEQWHAIAENQEELLYYSSLLTRQILSAVIEGDRRDTAEFMEGHGTSPPEEPVPWDVLLRDTELRVAALPQDTPINRARRQISDCCRKAASRGNGIYRLTVPTGGGKTLAALRYSLAACSLGQSRVFFVTSLLSVLEQNAAVIRKFIGNDRLILEHHSNLVQEKEDSGELDENELTMENWHAPIVITTLVQLLNTLFSGMTSCIRRMNALCNSVIIIDEVQSVPHHLLTLFNLALNFLAGSCHTTVVLCSATQPCLEKVEHPLRCATVPELVPYDAALWQTFCRTDILDRRSPQGYTVEELAAFCIDASAQSGSLLLICNTKAEARELFGEIQKHFVGEVFHLSTAMCMAHRILTLERIKEKLNSHSPILCVSTQLVEAGVDFSFGCVVRILAGMDNAAQAAGRCNRNGEYGELRPVYLVNLRGETLRSLPEIRLAQQASEAVLLRYQSSPGDYRDGLCGQDAIGAYYRELFAGMEGKARDGFLPDYHATLFELLSLNTRFRSLRPSENYFLIGQAFRTAGDCFWVFKEDTTDVLVPYGEGARLIAELAGDRAKYDMEYRSLLLRQAGQFSVSLYAHELRRLGDSGGGYPLCNGTVIAMLPEFYSNEIGFSCGQEIFSYLEV